MRRIDERDHQEDRRADPTLQLIRGRLLCLAVECPSCRSRPAFRISDELANAVRHEPPDKRIATYKCQRRGCGRIYDLTASAYQNAA